ncbi:hypothetical protein NDU88_004242, partial [Pleurodeles waltl]
DFIPYTCKVNRRRREHGYPQLPGRTEPCLYLVTNQIHANRGKPSSSSLSTGSTAATTPSSGSSSCRKGTWRRKAKLWSMEQAMMMSHTF